MIPILEPNALIYIPYPRVNCLKTISFTAAHTYIAHIWQYPPPARGEFHLNFSSTDWTSHARELFLRVCVAIPLNISPFRLQFWKRVSRILDIRTELGHSRYIKLQLCLCPLGLAIMLNFNISKVVYWWRTVPFRHWAWVVRSRCVHDRQCKQTYSFWKPYISLLSIVSE